MSGRNGEEGRRGDRTPPQRACLQPPGLQGRADPSLELWGWGRAGQGWGRAGRRQLSDFKRRGSAGEGSAGLGAGHRPGFPSSSHPFALRSPCWAGSIVTPTFQVALRPKCPVGGGKGVPGEAEVGTGEAQPGGDVALRSCFGYLTEIVYCYVFLWRERKVGRILWELECDSAVTPAILLKQ